MKLSTKLIAAAAAAVALCSQASAALVFNGSYAGPNSYIGTYNSAAFDSALFANGSLGTGAFTNTWVFNFGPSGSATMNANFVPGFPNTNSISNFNVALYTATASGGCTAASLSTPGTCTGLSLGSLVATPINVNSSSNIGFTPLVQGLYAMVITGTVVSTPTLYSGQLSTNPVPEPTSLALVGAALCGLGVSLRKRKAA